MYLFYVLTHELDDSLVVLGVLVLQATTLDDLHRFKRYLDGLYRFAGNRGRENKALLLEVVLIGEYAMV